MARTKFPAQMLRIDGKNSFCEILCSPLSIDKIMLNFVSYDANKPKGNRETGTVGIYIDIFEAGVLASDILSGRICKLGEISRKKAQEENNKYPKPVYSLLGGTAASKSVNNEAISRQFRIVPGSTKPWVLEALSGPGKETDEGLIAPSGPPTTAIRIALDDQTIKKVALSMQLATYLWAQTKFAPVVSPLMNEVRERVMETMQEHAKKQDLEESLPVGLPFEADFPDEIDT